jgi:hypothetical protein
LGGPRKIFEMQSSESSSAAPTSPLHAAASELEGGASVLPKPEVTAAAASSVSAGGGGIPSIFSPSSSSSSHPTSASASDVDAAFDFPATALDDAFAAIKDLQRTLEAEGVPAYAQDFDAATRAEAVTLGVVGTAELEARRAELEASRAREEAERARLHAERLERVRRAEAEARARIQAARASLQRTALYAGSEVGAGSLQREAALYRVYQQAFDQLRERIHAYQAVVRAKYGRLRLVDGESLARASAADGAGLARELRVDWGGLPQPLEVRVSRVRAVKNKLPDGLYILMVSLYNRLGGNPMRWSGLRLGSGGPLSGLSPLGLGFGGGDGDKPSATTAVRHRGRFYDVDLTFNQCIYATAPSQVALRPSHVWVFELFLLGGRKNPLDRVVAWAPLPACSMDLRTPATGRFRLPLMRGEVNPDIETFSALEQTVGRDLDTWLGNLYVELAPLPKSTVVLERVAGKKGAAAAAGAAGAGAGAAPKVGPSSTATASSPEAVAAAAAASTAASASASAASGAGSKAQTTVVAAAAAAAAGVLGIRRRKVREWDVEVAYTSALLRVRGEAREPKPLPGARVDVAGARRSSDPAPPPAEAVPDPLSTPASASGGNSRRRGALGEVLYVGSYEEEIETPGDGEDGGAAASRSAESTASSAVPWDKDSDDEDGDGTERVSTGGSGSGLLASSTTRRSAMSAAAAASTLPASGRRLGGAAAAAAASSGGFVAAVMSLSPGVITAERMKLASEGEEGDDAAAGSTKASSSSSGTAPSSSSSIGSAAVSAAGLSSSSASSAASAGVGASASASSAASASAPGGNPSSSSSSSSSSSRRSLPQSAFSYAVNKAEGRGLQGRRLRDSLRKLAFFQQELTADLSWGLIGTADFYLALVQLLCALYLRLFVHFAGQYFYLRALRVPVYDFAPLPYAMLLKYIPDALPVEVEVGLVVLGPVAVLAVFVVGCVISFLSQRLVGGFPTPLSRFLLYWGVGAVLDPLLIALVDAAAGRFDCDGRYPACAADIAGIACRCSEGDAWKLGRHFSVQEGSGVPGAVLTAILYAVLVLVAALSLYTYTLQLHLNGRMIDTYRRLHGGDEVFSTPADFEVSPTELETIVARAHRWRGVRGEVRRVAVCEYVVTDPASPGWKETTTHLLVYTLTSGGGRELHRHFLRRPDGALLEIFGPLELALATGMGGEGKAKEELARASATGEALAALLLEHAKTVGGEPGAAGSGGGSGDPVLSAVFFRDM